MGTRDKKEFFIYKSKVELFDRIIYRVLLNCFLFRYLKPLRMLFVHSSQFRYDFIEIAEC